MIGVIYRRCVSDATHEKQQRKDGSNAYSFNCGIVCADSYIQQVGLSAQETC